MPIIATRPRPYIMTFLATGTSYPVTSEEVQRVLDEYPVWRATRNRVILHGHNTRDPKQRVVIVPATKGGGPAFDITPDHRPRPWLVDVAVGDKAQW